MDPLGDWWDVVRFGRRDRWERLKGEALLALDHRIAAEMLLRFHEELVAHGAAAPDDPPDPFYADPRHHRIPRGDAGLEEAVTNFGLSPHPALVLVIEGETEADLVPRALDSFIPGWRSRVRLVNAHGVDTDLGPLAAYAGQVALGREHEEFVSLTRPFTRVLVVFDPEGSVALPEQRDEKRKRWAARIQETLPDPLRSSSVVAEQLLALVEVTTWGSPFEFAHFSDGEIARAATRVARHSNPDAQRVLAKSVRPIRRHGGDLGQLWKRRSYRGVSKPAVAGELWPVLERRLREAVDKGAISTIPLGRVFSIEAFARTLRVHRRTVLRQWEAGEADVATSPIATERLDLLTGTVSNDDDRAAEPEDSLAQEEDEQVAVASVASVGDTKADRSIELFAREQQLIDEMTEIADATRGLPDAKVRRLLKWIRENMLDGKGWNDFRVLIFTEYDDTKRYLREQLSAAFAHTDRADERIKVFHGPTPPEEREEIKRAFNAPPETNPVRILIATDAAREGLNFQAHCWHLFHFDVPWNPSRMEQRNGRIDRKLQPHDEVFCHYFVYLQRPEDRVLQILVRKAETIRKELGSLADVVESRLEGMLRSGIRHSRVDALSGQIEAADIDPEVKTTVRDELEEARKRQQDLRQEIEDLRTRLEASRTWIGLDHAHFGQALGAGLELIGAQGR